MSAILIYTCTTLLGAGIFVISNQAGAGVGVAADVSPQTCPYPQNMVCPKGSKYRTYNGSCNNGKNPLMGAASTPYRRIEPVAYADGISQPRLAKSGSDLPSARQIVLQYMNDDQKLSSDLSLYFPMFGQLITEDLVKTAVKVDRSTNAGGVDCGDDGCDTVGAGREICYPIPVLPTDPDFSDRRCLKIVRSTQVPQLNCSSGPAQQMNVVTHWLDGSVIYGSSLTQNQALRETNDTTRGRMLMVKSSSNPPGKDMLPLVKEHLGIFGIKENDVLGDTRASANGILSALHIQFVREHNYLESVLHNLNPDWDGEKLFQETRRIVIAFLQHITYNEYLPNLLGPKIIQDNNLNLLSDGYFTGYQENLDTRISLEFATSDHRFGHSMMPDKLHRLDASGQDNDLFLSQTYFDARPLYDQTSGGLDGLAEGAALQRSPSNGCAFSKQITRSLFTPSPPNGTGRDLASTDIQRGRDHGVAGYNVIRSHVLGLELAKNFEDLKPLMPQEKIRGLRQIYGSVDDIDQFVGGLSETSVEGGSVGPTFAGNIADSFKRLREGDRFWYENESAGFSEEQLRVIRGITLTEIICRNSDTILSLQRYSMKNVGAQENPEVLCSEFSDIDLSAWIEI